MPVSSRHWERFQNPFFWIVALSSSSLAGGIVRLYSCSLWISRLAVLCHSLSCKGSALYSRSTETKTRLNLRLYWMCTKQKVTINGNQFHNQTLTELIHALLLVSAGLVYFLVSGRHFSNLSLKTLCWVSPNQLTEVTLSWSRQAERRSYLLCLLLFSFLFKYQKTEFHKKKKKSRYFSALRIPSEIGDWVLN